MTLSEKVFIEPLPSYTCYNNIRITVREIVCGDQFVVLHFNAFSVTNSITCNGKVIDNEFDSVWNEAIVA
jgi:hypothetical protein